MTTLSPEARQHILKGESWLYHWTAAAGMSADELAEKTGIPIARIGSFVMEDEGPTDKEWDLIAGALGVSVEEIQEVQD